MSDDASYSNFLNQANQDTGGASAQSSGGGKQLKAANAPVPKSLQSLDTVYVSDADEPFEGVSLNWEGGELSAGMSFGFVLCSWSLVGRRLRLGTCLDTSADCDHRQVQKAGWARLGG